MTFIELIIAYCIICAGFCYYLAASKRRDPFTWTVIGLWSGILGMITLVGLPAKEPAMSQSDDDRVRQDRNSARVLAIAAPLLILVVAKLLGDFLN